MGTSGILVVVFWHNVNSELQVMKKLKGHRTPSANLGACGIKVVTMFIWKKKVEP